ncbi:MAG: xylan 1,4-beta-xylosidase [Actinomycetia bacterium]|nr:xylan 1,4-beta-xylosidase [Actinomycetes bacterium]
MDGSNRSNVSPVTMLTPRRGRHGRGPRRTLFLIALIGGLAGIVTTAIFLALTRDDGPGPVGVSAKEVGTVADGVPDSWPSWGFTHTQNSADGPQGFDQARADLARQPVVQAQSIMGWGVDNPEPANGEFNFASLDKRIQLIHETQGTPVITLCCSPDWMKGGAPGQTDWSKLEMAPSPEHYDDFAQLAAKVAARYPDVKYYVIWNEFKGFFDNGRNRWAYEDFTTFYNKVYTALKKVNSSIKVGGPYMVMNSNAPSYPEQSAVHGSWGSLDQRVIDAVRYWLKNKKGADFLAVDGWSLPEQRQAPVNEFDSLSKFSDVTKWLRGQGGDLPIWWAEWYVGPTGAGWADDRRGAVQAAAMMELIRGGAATALYWNPQTDTAANCAGCLWSGPQAGGRGTPTLAMLQNFAKWFPPGTTLMQAKSTNPAVRTLASDKQLLVVNAGGQAAKSDVAGKTLDLGPYEVRWINK